MYKVFLLKLLPLSGFELLIFSSQSASVFKLRAGRSGVGIPRAEGFFFLLQTFQSESGTPLTLLSNEYWVTFPWGKAAGVVKLISHLHLVPRVIMCGVLFQIPQYSLMVCAGNSTFLSIEREVK